MNAGKQERDSGIAIPSNIKRKTVEPIAIKAKRIASTPI
jgi:hypothetical protein